MSYAEEQEDPNQNRQSDDEEIPRKKAKLASRCETQRRVLRTQNAQSDNEDAEDQDNLDVTFVKEVAGRVSAIEMENFMCHSNLVIKFDITEANCFFIGGPNGSGKSALFAALNLGLGGGASQNDRGLHMKNYIKEGCTRAKIRITLENLGYGRIPEYGPKLIIERILNQTGSTVAIKHIDRKTQKEETVSTKRRDLQKILVQFGIQLENPIFWMTQDRCRQFLSDMKGARLFEIFVNATELDQAMKDYEECGSKMVSIRAGMDDIKKKALKAAGDRKKWLECLEEHEKLKEKRRVLEELSWFMLWGDAKTAFDEMERATEALKMTEKSCKEIGQNIINAKVAYEEQTADKNTNNNDEQEMKEKLKILNAQWAVHDETQRNNKAMLGGLQDNRRKCLQNISVKEANLGRCKNELEKYESGAAQSEDAKKRKRLNEAAAQFEEADAKFKTLERENKDQQKKHWEAKQRLTEINAELQQTKSSLGEQRKRFDKLKEAKENFERAAKDELSKFGPHTKAILDIIQANRQRFQRVPVGPIGMHVQVKDERWAYPIEQALGHNLAQYVVDNTQDDRLFKQLLTQRFGSGILNTVRIIVTRFLPRHNTRQPEGRWVTIERMLEINNDVAYNVLVDRAQIEATMLIERDGDARRIMDGDVHGRTGNQGFYRFFPNTREGYVHVQYLKVSQLPDTSRIDRDMQELSARFPDAQRQVEELVQQQKLATHEATGLGNTIQSIVTRMKETDAFKRDKAALMQKLEFELENNEHEGPINNLKQAIAEYDQLIRGFQSELADIEVQVEEARAELVESEETKKELNAQAEEIRILLRPFTEQARERDDRLRGLMNKIQAYEKTENELKQRYDKYEKTRVIQSRNYDNCIKQATEDTSGMPIPDGQKMPPDLQKLPQADRIAKVYKKVNCEVLEKLKTLPPLEEINKLLNKNTENVQANQDAEKRLIKLYATLDEAVKKRLAYFPILRHTITCQLRAEFRRLMHYRGVEADIDVNFNERKIEIPVRAKGNQQVIRDHKGLSGGERSYLTASFVMALWGIMESPFRCMDEFDVFMDSTNRKLIMELIIRFTTEDCKHSQFILFTPQGITELKEHNRLRVFNMPKLVDGRPPM
ncbi:unnamed protein product, partial [Mesorhabditis belari]|uniref:RecF/RecN/SMC N-terminal domain-containing protein n=1 Tax=Mesorhabditis belari TaxID=2138241 RepID=A0AAF3J2P5_9BILA